MSTDDRAAFEAWLMADHLLDATWNAERNCYDEFPAHLAFKAWIAATRRAIESELRATQPKGKT